MKWLKKFIEIDDGGLFARLLALSIIVILVIFTSLQKIGFGLKLFVMVGVILLSVKITKAI